MDMEKSWLSDKGSWLSQQEKRAAYTRADSSTHLSVYLLAYLRTCLSIERIAVCQPNCLPVRHLFIYLLMFPSRFDIIKTYDDETTLEKLS